MENVSKPWWVYIIETVSGKLYTGITTDVERRFAEHCSGTKSQGPKSRGAKFFRSDKPGGVVYTERCADRSEASKREAAIKKLSRRKKIALIGR